MKLYFIILECKEVNSKILNELAREDFIEIGGKWYDKNYATLYEHYLKKGKNPPIKIPNRKYVLDEYFKSYEPWAIYKNFSRMIREYRKHTKFEIMA
ncbi:MAG: hypothetical protein ABI863_11085 [Ginsengibacter sp.]